MNYSSHRSNIGVAVSPIIFDPFRENYKYISNIVNI